MSLRSAAGHGDSLAADFIWAVIFSVVEGLASIPKILFKLQISDAESVGKEDPDNRGNKSNTDSCELERLWKK